ncbi:glycine N-acyltransferase-like protein [Lethenteron reissneri]|uniref:glycine N-acyltransferase-like protein n=1 Tax=Lethenteron reissneri TaxID=7753 RepID=UPI002AB71B8D|nr:glycine N-acyltransferase-like protein [Lethenteron reissneri]XP_061427295.1 glycine N-acyltransferase-like protein [Lethenteron reissneri]
MIILRSKQHLRELMVALSRSLPHSAETYGWLYYGLDGMSGPMDVYVDSWPNFQAVIVQPTYQAGEKLSLPKYSTFASNPSSFANLWNVVEWKEPFMLEGVDADFQECINDMAAKKDVRVSRQSDYYYMATTNEPDTLRIRKSELDLEMSTLNTSHVELVWNSWTHRGEPDSLSLIQACISKGLPNSSVLDGSGNPVAWLLTHLNGSIAFGYVKPDYRRKGLLHKCMAALLDKCHGDAPIYGYVHEENTASLQFATEIGFSMLYGRRYVWVTIEP